MNPHIQKAISIRQPWAWLVIHAGKNIENRAWGSYNPARREVQARAPFRVFVHAAKGMTVAEYHECKMTVAGILTPEQYQKLPAYSELERGGIIGSVEIGGWVDKSRSPWFFGPGGLLLCNPKPLPFHPCNGSLGFFNATHPQEAR